MNDRSIATLNFFPPFPQNSSVSFLVKEFESESQGETRKLVREDVTKLAANGLPNASFKARIRISDANLKLLFLLFMMIEHTGGFSFSLKDKPC